MSDEASERRDAEVIRAAGGVVWRETPAGRTLAVIHRPKYDDWSLPKGKLQAGETPPQAAIREVREETACDAALGPFIGCATYPVPGAQKLVLFWQMTVTAEHAFAPSTEVDRLAWLSPADALSRLDHPAERVILEEALSE